jgi:hypothetical protein
MEFSILEKKVVQDLFYKKKSHPFLCDLQLELKNFTVIYLDKESKILGYKKNFDCAQQKLFLPFSENKKFLKSTIFGRIKFLNN